MGMTAYEKEKLKEKDEARLEEMKEQIEEELAAEAAREGKETTDDTSGAEEGSASASAEPGTSEDTAAPEDVETLKARHAEELAEKETRYLRLQADFENFRRRTRQEKEELAAVVTQGLLKDMLPLLDNFERALASDKGGDGFRTGVEMIYKQFAEALRKNGLEPIETEGKKFDPNFHQAVMRVEDPEREADTIAAELQKGYMAKGRVIRPSMVQVVTN